MNAPTHGIAQPAPDPSEPPARCPACQGRCELPTPANLVAMGVRFHAWRGVHVRRRGQMAWAWVCPHCGNAWMPDSIA